MDEKKGEEKGTREGERKSIGGREQMKKRKEDKENERR